MTCVRDLGQRVDKISSNKEMLLAPIPPVLLKKSNALPCGLLIETWCQFTRPKVRTSRMNNVEAYSGLSQGDAFRLNNLMLEFQAFERLKQADTARAANQGPPTLPNQTDSIFSALGMPGLLDWKPMGC